MAKKRSGGRSKDGSSDEQVEILRAIWNEMKALNSRVNQTNARLDQVRVELEDEIDALRRRVVESEVRLATTTTQLSGDVRSIFRFSSVTRT